MESKTIRILNLNGEPSGEFPLKNQAVEAEKGEQAVHDSVVAFLAKNRAGTASTKQRGEINGTGAKPWRQKGTGRARAGSRKSPIWRGGGIVFGPKPRSFAKGINRKVQQLALRRAFTERMLADDVVIVDNLQVADHKTKGVLGILNTIGVGTDVLIVTSEMNSNLILAARNLPMVEVMSVGAVNPYWMLLFKKIVFTKAAMEIFIERLCAVREKK